MVTGGAGASGYIYSDWFVVRKYANPEPTFTFGSESSAPYTLSYAAGSHGSITGSTTQYVQSGNNGTAVTAVPDNGYIFSQWSDSVTDNPRTDTIVTGNISVTAQFTQGHVVTNPPASTTVVLSSNNSTDVTSDAQTGSQTVVVGKSGSYQVATFDVSFTSDHDWSDLTVLSDGTRSVFHYPGGYTSLPGHVGGSYTLLVHDRGGTRVRVCPGASSLAEVTSGCSGEYTVTTSSSGVSKTTISGTGYWVITGLTGSGGEDLGQTSSSAPLFDDATLMLTISLCSVGGWFIVRRQIDPAIRQR
jgi:hypothetical protein